MSKTDLQNQNKPDLPEKIETVTQARDFFDTLEKYKWQFHPDADALTATFPEINSPNQAERRRLNKLMDQCTQLSGADPYTWYQSQTEKLAKN